MIIDKKIVEYWHYYQEQWPTLWTIQSISIFEKLKKEWFFWDNIFTVLFIDDVHVRNPHESESEIYDFDFESLKFDMKVLESRTKIVACQLIDSLQKDPDIEIIEDWWRKYLKWWWKYKIELSDNRNPSCVMMDAALTLLKMWKKTGTWLKTIINILPNSYEKQQQNLHKVITELFRIWVIKEPIHLQSLLFQSDAVVSDILETIHSSAKKKSFKL